MNRRMFMAGLAAATAASITPATKPLKGHFLLEDVAIMWDEQPFDYGNQLGFSMTMNLPDGRHFRHAVRQPVKSVAGNPVIKEENRQQARVILLQWAEEKLRAI